MLNESAARMLCDQEFITKPSTLISWCVVNAFFCLALGLLAFVIARQAKRLVLKRMAVAERLAIQLLLFSAVSTSIQAASLTAQVALCWRHGFPRSLKVCPPGSTCWIMFERIGGGIFRMLGFGSLILGLMQLKLSYREILERLTSFKLDNHSKERYRRINLYASVLYILFSLPSVILSDVAKTELIVLAISTCQLYLIAVAWLNWVYGRRLVKLLNDNMEVVRSAGGHQDVAAHVSYQFRMTARYTAIFVAVLTIAGGAQATKKGEIIVATNAVSFVCQFALVWTTTFGLLRRYQTQVAPANKGHTLRRLLTKYCGGGGLSTASIQSSYKGGLHAGEGENARSASILSETRISTSESAMKTSEGALLPGAAMAGTRSKDTHSQQQD